MPDTSDDGLTRFDCPHCGKRIKAGDAAAGRTAICPKCNGRFFIPAPEADASDDEEPVARRRKSAAPWAPLVLGGLMLVTVAGVVALVVRSYSPPEADRGSLLAEGAKILLWTAAYFLPTFVAAVRAHSNLAVILLVNLFFGWLCGIGWVVALAWAVASPSRAHVANGRPR